MEITDLMRTVDGRVALTSCKSDRQNAINALTSRPNLVICNSASWLVCDGATELVSVPLE